MQSIMGCAEAIIVKLGGTRKAARLLRKPHSTVQSWKKSGHIPAWHQNDVIARSGGLITPADFFEPPRSQDHAGTVSEAA